MTSTYMYIVVSIDIQMCSNQKACLNNRKNKVQLIRLVGNTFEQKHINCSRNACYSDSLMCDVAIYRVRPNQRVVLVGNNTDLLVILTDSETDDMNIYNYAISF